MGRNSRMFAVVATSAMLTMAASLTAAGAASPPQASPKAAVPAAGAKTGAALNLPRIPWEGGSAYWGKFPKANAAGWDNPSFFPISVFLGKPDAEHVTSLKDAGVNTFMGVENDGSSLTNVTNSGLFAMPQQNEWTSSEVGNNPGAVGWFISDECEMGYGGCTGEQAQELATQRAYVAKVKKYNDGRFIHANFGNGILRTFWAPATMSQHVQLMDSASADKYTYTSPDVANIIDGVHNAPDWPDGVPVARAYSYGWQADQMKRFQSPTSPRPVWTFVETAKPYLEESGARSITPNQIEGAVWSAIIHEARGIAYFQHNNNGTCGNYSIVDCPAVHAKVKSIDATVRSLAPVINTQSYYNSTQTVQGYKYYRYSFNNGTDTMLKTYNGSAYIFAGIGMKQSFGSKTFKLPAGVTGKSVTVVGENRSIPVANGAFTDAFASEYTHHIYRIAL